jgi:hypothetical protein
VSGTLTVPAGTTLAVDDALGTIGVAAGAFGTLEVASDQPLFAAARVTAAALGGGRFGFGLAGRPLEDALAPPSTGLFLSATDNGWDVFRSDLFVYNPGSAPASATLRLTDAWGSSVGTRSITVGPGESRVLTSAWFSISGYGTDFGRIDVVPDASSPPLIVTLLRQDQKTLDTDAIVPLVINH